MGVEGLPDLLQYYNGGGGLSGFVLRNIWTVPYLALLFLSAQVLTRPSVEYAKDLPDHFFAFPGLVWSNICWLEKGCSCFVQFCLSLLVWSVCKRGFGMALITWTQSKTIFLSTAQFWHGDKRTNKQPNNQVNLEQACSLQSFEISFALASAQHTFHCCVICKMF